MTDTDTQREYTDPSLPTDRRIDDLLDRMTLTEKIAQLTSVRANDVLTDGDLDREAAARLLEHGVGHFTRIGGEGGLDPEQAAAVTDELQSILTAETRLGIPAIPHEECLSGYMGPGGTTYPQSAGLASTWAPDLVEEMTTRIRRQLLAIGTAHALSPVLDLGRDPRWGRTEETFGEDPYLVAAMATAYVRGLQGPGPTSGVSATLKHFAGHGLGEGGKNRSSVNVGERELRESHLFPFEAALATADADSVMNAYHDIDGIPCTADPSLLTGVLREEWGFDGTVVSDYNSVRYLRDQHGVARTARDAAVQAVEAGVDVELPLEECYGELVAAVEAGALAEETIDTAVRRVLRQKFEKGLFEDAGVDPDGVTDAFDRASDREHARRLARESITLLKNDDDLLPLAGTETVAVLGPKADAPEEMLGDYAYAAHYPELAVESDAVTPLAALEARLGADAIRYARGCPTTGRDTSGFDDAVAAAETADVAVAFVGARSAVSFEDVDDSERERPDVPTSGEGVDVVDLGLPGVQQELVEAVHETDTPLVVVLISGKPHAIEWIDEHVPAVAHAWLPGDEGGTGVADVLLGDHNPSGRLPFSVARTVGQLPVYYSRKSNSYTESHVYTANTPLYPFGHGCSYTDFSYGALDLSTSEITPAGTVEASVTVENVGSQAGHEVVQLYVHDRYPSQARPVQELRGFERVFLEPGESARVTFELSGSQLAFHDANMDLVVEPGAFEVRVGRSAEAIEATATFDVTGTRWVVPSTGRAYFSDTRVGSDDEPESRS